MDTIQNNGRYNFSATIVKKEARKGVCPYGLQHESGLSYFETPFCDASWYESALKDGWRRSGFLFYRNNCSDNCDSCIPLRVDAWNLKPTKSQRRSFRINQDLVLSVGESAFDPNDYKLFKKYLVVRHPDSMIDFDEEQYVSAYIQSPIGNIIIRYHDPLGRLVAISYLDVLPDGFSSVYFVFDPDEGRRSPGIYSVLAEAKLLRTLGKRWYYLGFWIPENKKMGYKADFSPAQIARNNEWQDLPIQKKKRNRGNTECCTNIHSIPVKKNSQA